MVIKVNDGAPNDDCLVPQVLMTSSEKASSFGTITTVLTSDLPSVISAFAFEMSNFLSQSLEPVLNIFYILIHTYI